MSTNIYVGNLPFSTDVDEIRELFSAYGTVESVNLITDRETGRLRGFGFVDMSSGGQEAIDALHQSDLGGRVALPLESAIRDAPETLGYIESLFLDVVECHAALSPGSAST